VTFIPAYGCDGFSVGLITKLIVTKIEVIIASEPYCFGAKYLSETAIDSHTTERHNVSGVINLHP